MPPSAVFHALVELVDRGELESHRAVLKRPSLPMVHMTSVGMSLWDSLMYKEEKKKGKAKFLSLAMRHRDGFRPLLELMAASNPTLPVSGGTQAGQHHLAAHHQGPVLGQFFPIT